MPEPSRKKTSFQQEVERVSQILSKEIYSGRRLPLERLVESDLAEKYKIGRMVVRQVLARLELIGLVAIKPYKGASIAAITIKHIREKYEIVAMMAGYSAKLAVGRMSKKDVKRLEGNLEEQRKTVAGDNKEWERLNTKFHKLINRNNGNEVLRGLLKEHYQFTNYWFMAYVLQEFGQSLEDHEEIVKAFQKGDAEAARQSMENHFILACEDLIRHLQNNAPIGMIR